MNPQSFASLLRRLERVSPSLAAELVFQRWRTPRAPRAPRADAQLVMDDAVAKGVRVRQHRIATYRWGSGPHVVLLVHGWEGRASDFTPMVRELRSRKRTIIALDAPGHGASTGRRTTIPDYGLVLADLARGLGRCEAVLSHSFGTPAVALATRHGLAAERYVSISGVAQIGNLVTTFCDALGVSGETSARVRVLAENRAFAGDRSIWERLSAAQNPLPAASPLLAIHDRNDHMISFDDAGVLARAHGTNTRLLATEGFGHSRILGADPVLDAVAEFLGDGVLQQDRQAEAA